MSRIDFFLGLCLFVLAFPVRTPGCSLFSPMEVSSFALSGTVFADGSDRRLSQAHIVLCDDGGDPLQETTTNDSGEFSFQGIRAGQYILRVQASGFQSADLHIDLSFASDRGISVNLKPEHSDSSPPTATQIISVHDLAIPDSARKLLASGKQKLYVSKNPQDALHDFQSATKKAPSFYEAFYQTGMAYLALQQPEDAEKQFRKAVALSDNKYADANIALGTLLLQRHEQSEGEPLLRLGLASNPQSWPGQVELSKLELSRGHLEPALAAAQSAAQLAPQQPIVYRLLAVILLQQKNYAALVSALDSYIALDPSSPAGLRAQELRVQAQKEMDKSAESAAAK
ncbi:MAG TPA: carboxypeptidase regulatory-like domain-containing protein [Verrucomicrobiae bacterium]|nr:carboxypeptidase regulatory-like domain-containing protein [Verrucomicrobiae bacterium]